MNSVPDERKELQEQKITAAVKLPSGLDLIASGFVILRNGKEPFVRVDHTLYPLLTVDEGRIVAEALFNAWLSRKWGGNER